MSRITCRDVILNSVIKQDGEDSLLSLSKHKYASNVVEKLIQFGSSRQREMVLIELLNVSASCGSSRLSYLSLPQSVSIGHHKTHEKSNVCVAIDMAKDNIANYVIKTAIECARADQREQIMEELSRNRIELVCR